MLAGKKDKINSASGVQHSRGLCTGFAVPTLKLIRLQPINKQITLHKAAGRRLGGWEGRSQDYCFTHVLENLSAPREKQTQTSVVKSIHFVPASEHTGIKYNLLCLISVYPEIKTLSRVHVVPREYRNMLYFFEIP